MTPEGSLLFSQEASTDTT